MFNVSNLNKVDQACPTIFIVQATLAKFGLYVGNTKFST